MPTLVHQPGPVGLSGPSAAPDPIVTPPLVFGGARPDFFNVTPVSRFQQQGSHNACVWHGCTAPMESEALARGVMLQVCRSDGYSGALYLDGHEGQDVGVSISAMCHFIREKGVVSEWERPWGTDDPTIRSKPSLDSRRVKGVDPAQLALDVGKIQDAILISGGVGYGQEVRSNYDSLDAQGVIPLPAGALRGYHFTCFEGWKPGLFLMRQSWLNWGVDHPLAAIDPRFKHLIGKRGYAWVPMEWVKPGIMFEPTWFRGSLEVE